MDNEPKPNERETLMQGLRARIQAGESDIPIMMRAFTIEDFVDASKLLDEYESIGSLSTDKLNRFRELLVKNDIITAKEGDILMGISK